MKHFFWFFLVLLFWSFLISSSTFAEGTSLTREDTFIFFASEQTQVPESFQYIQLSYRDIKKASPLEDALQKLVYVNAIKNTPSFIYPTKNISIFELEALATQILKLDFSQSGSSLWENKTQNASIQNLEQIQALITTKKVPQKISISINGSSLGAWENDTFWKKGKILYDVYETLKEGHYDRETLSDDTLIEGAISGLANGVGDTYTTYFPPVESEDFFESLDGEYEGIWAYVEMPSPGILMVISPIVWSPAETAGVKWGDRVTHIDGKQITEKNSLKEVVTWIKGTAGTKVELTIVRTGNTSPRIITVERAKIVIKDVEYKKLDNATFYIQIKNFWDHAKSGFEEALTTLKEDSRVKKVIIDVRNNPGWYLDEVSNMLSYFVPAGEATAIVSSGKIDSTYNSLGYTLIDASKYKFVLLQNKGSASASEIMVGTLKDYFPEATIIGEQSYGKGSVQSLKNYYDGSTLKYTSAKWFTGKTRNGIDKVGITPDIFLEFDTEAFEKYKSDNQLEKALQY